MFSGFSLGDKSTTVGLGVALTFVGGALAISSFRRHRRNKTPDSLVELTPVADEPQLTAVASLSPSTRTRARTYTIAITGGPCSGKSTCMESLREALQSRGYQVYIVPEVATLLFNAGVNLGAAAEEHRTAQQLCILRTVLHLEDTFQELAQCNKGTTVILCDRGTMDGRAYCTEDQWADVLQRSGYTLEELRDSRYDCVVHLVTAANGAEAFYTKANNPARRETAEDARRVDQRTLQKWLGHHRIGIFDNSTDFKTKIARVEKFIFDVVGSPSSALTRLAIRPVLPCDLPEDYAVCDVQLFELNAKKDFTRETLLVKTFGGEGPQVAERPTITLFFLHQKFVDGTERTLRLSKSEFESQSGRVAGSKSPKVKRVFSFLSGGHYYQVKQPLRGFDETSAAYALFQQTDKPLPPFLVPLSRSPPSSPGQSTSSCGI